MQKQAYYNFQNFLARLSQAANKRLSENFPHEAAARFCAELSRDEFRQLLMEIRKDWIIHVGSGAAAEKHSELTAVLFVYLIGPFNRIALPADVDRPKLLHSFLSLLSAMLEQETVRPHFTGLSESLMKAA